ncbi:MAG: DUF1501 domain-containing protein [Pirellula sp.]
MINRRELFQWAGRGIGSTAFLSLLMQDGVIQAHGASNGALNGKHHLAPLAKRVIHIVACGGVSQIDSFDYKPELVKHHGKSLSGERPDVFFGRVGLLRKNDWEFRQRGESGLWISELFPNLATVADELTMIHSMVADTSNHTPATFQENTGFRLNGFPVFGAWASYGLGCETEDLPAFVVIPDPRGVPAGGSINWTNGFLPAQHQGVVVRSQGIPIDDLFHARGSPAGREADMRSLLYQLNERHRKLHQDDELLARMKSYELAARMQRVVPEVTNLEQETSDTHRLYGMDQPVTSDFGRACLLSRRLLESGVRFVQLFSGGAFGSPRINWDGHEDMIQNHGQEALRIDRPIAGLIADLRRRGMLNDTLVLFTSEFGRTPFTQSADDVVGKGRDHNQFGFTVWMAGAGLRHGFGHGATDEIGMRAVENPVRWPDFHATILHLLGVDHERLTYYHNGIRRRLTDVSGTVIREVLSN